MTAQPAAPTRPRPRIQPPPAPITHQAPVMVKPDKLPGYSRVGGALSEPYGKPDKSIPITDPLGLKYPIEWACEVYHALVDYLLAQDAPWDGEIMPALDKHVKGDEHVKGCETCQRMSEQMRQGADNGTTASNGA